MRKTLFLAISLALAAPARAAETAAFLNLGVGARYDRPRDPWVGASFGFAGLATSRAILSLVGLYDRAPSAFITTNVVPPPAVNVRFTTISPRSTTILAFSSPRRTGIRSAVSPPSAY